MNTILEVKNLRVVIDDVEIIDNLSFSLARGENLSIIGPNGAGKTILLKALMGTIPYEGTIQWASDMRLGYVPQKIDADRHLPITFENLFNAKRSFIGGSEKDVEETCQRLVITPAMQRTPVGHLSGGQFQRALIAFALLGNPTVLLFDEPTASIDKPGEEQIYELLHRLQEQYQLTTILVSHDLSFVYRYSDKVLCLNKQRVCFGTPQEALKPSVLEQVYGSPTTFYHHLHETEL